MLQKFTGHPESVRNKLNEIVSALEPLTKIKGDECFIRVDRNNAGVTVSLNIQQVQAALPIVSRREVRVKLTSSVSGRVGWYNAKSAIAGVNDAATGALVEGDVSSSWFATEDVLVMFVPDLGASAASITDFTALGKCIHMGHFVAPDTTSGKPIVIVTGAGVSNAYVLDAFNVATGGSKINHDGSVKEIRILANSADVLQFTDISAGVVGLGLKSGTAAGQVLRWDHANSKWIIGYPIVW